MNAIKKCNECGNALPETSTDDTCPSCLLEWGLGDTTDDLTTVSDVPGSIPSSTPGQPSERLSYFGDYELLEEIDRGGMGVIYRARQVTLNRIVAVKMVLGGQFASNDAKERFRAEAEAVANLKHPNIVAIHQVGEHEGYYYFSMDFVEGDNLGRLIERDRPSTTKTAKLVQTIAEAIQYAHEQGILHRDLKPSNILIDSLGAPHVTDFGLAKKMESNSELTISGQILGSPNYMPPEQAEGKHTLTGPTGDVYSLGAIIYHLLTGRPPFGGKTLSETLNKVIHEDVVALRMVDPGIPIDLETICLKCLEKDPKRRYRTSGELADELGRFLKDEPIKARPVAWTEKTRRWCRRKPAVAALTASLIAVFLLGFAGTLWQLKQSQAKSELVQQQLARRNVLSGVDLMQEGDYLKSLLWFTEALRTDEEREAEFHRMRIASVLQMCPRLVQIISHDQEPIAASALSPTDDRLATVGGDLTLRMWDIQTGEELFRVQPSHQWFPHSVAFSPDGRFLTVGLIEGDGTAIVLDAQDGEILLGPVPHQYAGAPRQTFQPIFHPSSQIVLLQSKKRTLQLWSITRREKVGKPMHHAANITRVQFNASGNKLWSKSAAGYTIWEIPTGATIQTMLERDGRQQETFLSPHDSSMLSGTLLHATSSGPTKNIGNRRKINWADFNPDGHRMVTGSQDGVARVWHISSGELLSESQKHYQGVERAWFNPDGRSFVTLNTDNTARVWDTDLGTALTPTLPHKRTAGHRPFSSSGRYLATMHPKQFLYVWDMHRDVNTPVRLKPTSGFVGGINVRPHGHIPNWEDSQGVVGLLHPESRKTRPLKNWFDETGRFVIVEGEMGKAQIWQKESGLPLTPQFQSAYSQYDDDYRKVDLPSLEETTDDLIALAELLSGNRLDGQGGWKLLEPFEIANQWVALKNRHEELLGSDSIGLERWHRREARNAERVLDWRGAAFHWGKLEQLKPDRRAYSDRRKQVRTWGHAQAKILSASDADYWTVRQGIPPRDPTAPDRLIDLRKHLTGKLPTFHGFQKIGLFPGIQTLGGVMFDLSGSVELSRKNQSVPKEIQGIKIGQRCDRIHFLHQAKYADFERALPIAEVIVNYETGESIYESLENGIHMSNNWSTHLNTHGLIEPKRANTVWMGTEYRSNAYQTVERLFEYTWKNPNPDRMITTLDVRSLHSEASYSLLAITLE